MKKFLITALFLSAFCSAGIALGFVDLAQAEKILAPGLVDVVCPLEYDDMGEVPSAVGLYCAACSDFHNSNPESLLHNGLELKFTGFLVADRQVIAPDLLIGKTGPREIRVRYGKEEVRALVRNVYPEQCAVMLELEKPLKDARPLNIRKFDAGSDKELYIYSRIVENGCWTARLKRFSPQRDEQLFGSDRFSQEIPGSGVVLNSRGEVAALLGNSNETFRKSFWYTPYTQWQALSYTDFLKNYENLQTRLNSSILPAAVYFNERTLSRREKLMGITQGREIRSFVFKLPGGKVIMPLLLTPRQSSLIDKVVVQFKGRQVKARVISELRHFGCVLLDLPPEVDLPPIADRCRSLNSELGMMVWNADIHSYADRVNVDLCSDMLGAVIAGYRNNLCGINLKKSVVPYLLFALNGDLLGINLNVRAFDYKRSWPVIDICNVEKLFSDAGETVPFNAIKNSPDSIGFLGVEYQCMNNDLAKSMKLERETGNGSFGLLVSFVYPGSLADKMKIKAGDVLLKIILPSGGAPIVLDNEGFGMEQQRQFPWENLDALPEMYFSEIPEPWTGVKTPLSNQLTNIGIGNDFILIAVSGGKVAKLRAAVENAPEYFEIAPSYRSPTYGLEVRNITFEVARYFRMEKDSSGVIVSEVDAGSSASTAGLRPFEIITAVNDKPVHNVNDFKNALAGCNEVSLAVRRLAARRVVTLKPKNIGPVLKK